MEQIIVVSSNNSPDYYFYSPYIKKAWNSYGWKVCTMVTDDVPLDKIDSDYTIVVPSIEGLRQETIAQASRLYAANHFSGDYLLMTSDMDLLPLSDYWKPSPNNITIYGHDLTWNTYLPMGYCAMSSDNWKKYFNLTGDTYNDLIRDSKDPIVKNNPYSDNWETWWGFDWDLLTRRLMPHKQLLTFVNRGQVEIAGTTLARGRVDRYNWEETMKQSEWIDAHCHNSNVKDAGKMNDFLIVFDKIYGSI